jgi:hypothetical protein
VQNWTDPAWRAGAYEWINTSLAALGLRVAGEIEQPHVRPWATAMRVPTDDGVAWFKANAGSQAYEAGVVEVLAKRRPDAVPQLLAVDAERSWLLMADGGTRLREIVEADRDLSRWRDVLPVYAQLQLDVARDRDALLAAGAPDRRLATLPTEYERLLDEVQGIDAAELARLRALTPYVSDVCAELADLGVPETIQHDDLHDGQVFVRDGGYLIFDWGDSCVTQPFLTMAVTLEGVLSWGLDDIEDSYDVAPLRAAYLAPFAHYGSDAELQRGLDHGLRLGWLTRALSYEATAGDHPPGALPDELRDAVAVRLQMFAAKAP